MSGGGYFQLSTATVCELGEEHDRPVVVLWNAPASAVGALAGADR